MWQYFYTTDEIIPGLTKQRIIKKPYLLDWRRKPFTRIPTYYVILELNKAEYKNDQLKCKTIMYHESNCNISKSKQI